MQKKTAVEWLVEQVNADCLNSTFIRKELIDQAKKMEREQQRAAQMDMFHKMNDIPCDAAYLEKREVAEEYSKNYYKKGGEQ